MGRGELESLGTILRRCLEAAEDHRYARPRRRKPGADRDRMQTSEQANKQLELFALADIIPEAYD